jgi:hypothetical protein
MPLSPFQGVQGVGTLQEQDAPEAQAVSAPSELV